MRSIGGPKPERPRTRDPFPPKRTRTSRNTFPDNRPSHVYVSIWRDRADWEALAAQQAFLDLLESRGALFDWNLAEVYHAVK